MKKVFILCGALMLCALLLAQRAGTQTTKGGGTTWNGGTVSNPTTFNNSVAFNSSVTGLPTWNGGTVSNPTTFNNGATFNNGTVNFSGTTVTGLPASSWSGGSVAQDIYPNSSITYNLGLSGSKWLNLYASTVNITNLRNTLDGSGQLVVFDTMRPSGGGTALGTTSNRWANGYFANLDSTGTATLGGITTSSNINANSNATLSIGSFANNFNWLYVRNIASNATTGAIGTTGNPFAAGYFTSLVLNGLTYNFPTSHGASGRVLTNDGSGGLSWAAPAAAAITYSERPGTTQTVTNSTTLVDDDSISVALAANSSYEIEIMIVGTSNSTSNGGLKIKPNFVNAGFSWAGLLRVKEELVQDSGTTVYYNRAMCTNAFFSPLQASFNGGFIYTMRGIIANSSADTLRIQYAQNTATANGLTISPGSYIKLRKF